MSPIAVITSAGAGAGHATALEFGHHGCDVVFSVVAVASTLAARSLLGAETGRVCTPKWRAVLK